MYIKPTEQITSLPVARRNEVITWCIQNEITFDDPTVGCPQGWRWEETGDDGLYRLKPMFDIPRYDPVDIVDIARDLMYKVCKTVWIVISEDEK